MYELEPREPQFWNIKTMVDKLVNMGKEYERSDDKDDDTLTSNKIIIANEIKRRIENAEASRRNKNS